MGILFDQEFALALRIFYTYFLALACKTFGRSFSFLTILYSSTLFRMISCHLSSGFWKFEAFYYVLVYYEANLNCILCAFSMLIADFIYKSQSDRFRMNICRPKKCWSWWGNIYDQFLTFIRLTFRFLIAMRPPFDHVCIFSNVSKKVLKPYSLIHNQNWHSKTNVH